MASMTTPRIYSPAQAPNNAHLVVAWINGSVRTAHLAEADAAKVTDAINAIGAPTGPEVTARIVSLFDESRQILAVWLPADPTPQQLREAAGFGVRALGSDAEILVSLPYTDADEWQAIAEGSMLGAYEFSQFTEPDFSKTVAVVATHEPQPETLARIDVVVDSVNRVRHLVNLPANLLGPDELEDAAHLAASEVTGITVSVLKGQTLAEARCGGIIGVGKGSIHEPRLVKVEWAPADAKAHVALVGKGITFDSGGMSLKSHEGLIDMKTDMTGAATVLEVVRAAASLKVPARVTAWMCIAENMLSGGAMHVGDVLEMANGMFVEVNNTDAEGRLVLADGLTHAIAETPDEVIDIATLTGAQIRALGNRTAGLMGTDSVVDDIIDAAEESGEYIWPVPLPAYLKKTLESTVATMRNTGTAEAGMLTAGLFLKEFAGDTPWAHIDIAGPSFNTGSPWGDTPRGATGYGVRTLLSHIEALADRA